MDERLGQLAIERLLALRTWGLLETVAWIVRPDPEFVAHESRQRAGCVSNRRPFHLSASIHDIGGILAIRGDQRSIETLEIALLRGCVSASYTVAYQNGVRFELPRERPIDRREWAELRLVADDVIGGYIARGNSPMEWLDGLRFDRESVMRTFPSHPPRSRSTVAAERQAERELEAAARRHRDGSEPVPVRARWEKTCGLGSRAAARVWSKVAGDFPELSERKGKPHLKRGG